MPVHRVLSTAALGAVCLSSLLLIAPQTAFAQPADEAPPADEATPAEPEPSPLARAPRNADEYFDAILLMVRLTRPELAAQYLDELLALEPDEETLLALREKHGTGTFLQLARVAALQPQAGDLLDRLTQASLARISDPAYLDGVLERLAGSPREQAEAVDELKHLGSAAVPPLLARMSNPESNVDRSLVVATLIQMGEPAVAPLLGAMRAPGERMRGDAIDALGYIATREQVLPHLWRPAFDAQSPPGVQHAARAALARLLFGDPERVSRVPSFGVGQRLRDAARSYFRGDVEWTLDEAGLVSLWVWDEEQGTVVEHRVSPASASMYVGQQLARDAMALEPANVEGQTLFLALALAGDRERAGWDQPLSTGSGTAHDLALIAGAGSAERVLDLALTEENPAAAIAALDVLGSVGTRHLLQKTSESWPPLIRALDAPDARVQFAAASAIMQLDPERGFGRAERVVEIFARELAGTSQPQSVIIDPNVDRASIVASLVGAIGFDASIAATGQEGFERAVSQPIGLAVVHLNSIRWELSQTVANFRADARTRNVPIAIYGPPGMQDSVRELLTAQPVVYVEEANDSRDLSRTLRPLLAQMTPPPLTDDQRSAQRMAAAYWLRHIAQGHRSQVFDLRPAETALANAVTEPALAPDALIGLGGVPTASAQERLAAAVTAPGFDLAIRETAALQLAFHIQRFGVLVQNGTLSQLNETFEQATEPAMQTALASVIGSLKPADESLSRTLREYPLPTAPAD